MNVECGQPQTGSLERKMGTPGDNQAVPDVVGCGSGVPRRRNRLRKDPECGGEDPRVARLRGAINSLPSGADRRGGGLFRDMNACERR